MKKKVLIILPIALLVCCFFIYFFIYKMSDTVFIENRINLYNDSKTIDDLHKLCNTLSYTEDFENKVIYFEEYIAECEKDTVEQIQVENNGYITKSYVDSYKAEYCLALLHLNKYQEFEEYYKYNFVLDTEKNCFYNTVMYELQNFNWTNKQLEFLLKVLNGQLINIENKNLKHQNHCIGFVISSKLLDDKQTQEYKQLIEQYNQLEDQ